MYCCCAANSFEICSFRASAKLFSAMSEPYRAPMRPIWSGSPAKARRGGHRLERAGGQPGLRAGGVVSRRGDVVGGVGMEEGGQILDVPATRSELPLAAAVGADALVVAVVVG